MYLNFLDPFLRGTERKLLCVVLRREPEILELVFHGDCSWDYKRCSESGIFPFIFFSRFVSRLRVSFDFGVFELNCVEREEE